MAIMGICPPPHVFRRNFVNKTKWFRQPLQFVWPYDHVWHCAHSENQLVTNIVSSKLLYKKWPAATNCGQFYVISVLEIVNNREIEAKMRLFFKTTLSDCSIIMHCYRKELWRKNRRKSSTAFHYYITRVGQKKFFVCPFAATFLNGLLLDIPPRRSVVLL